MNTCIPRKIAICAALANLSGISLYADFRYDETARITGGVMAGMMKVVGVFSKQAREPIKSTIVVQGNRMVRRTADQSEITDLDAETITEINFRKKTYSVATFAEIRQAMEEALRKMDSSKEKQPEVTIKGSVKETGQSKTISGFEAKEVILTLEMESTDPDSGKKGSMVVSSDMWLAPKAAGYDEIADFNRRMAEKMNWAPGGNMLMANPQIAKGMAGLMKESSKLDGMPVFQTVSMGFKGEGMPEGSAQGSAPPPQPAPQRQENAEAPSAGGAVGSALGGRLGRFGRFGRKKTEEPKQEQPAPEQQPQAQQTAQPQHGGAPAGSLLEMTTEMSGFSNSAADGAEFQVPAGFKKVESERVKRMR